MSQNWIRRDQLLALATGLADEDELTREGIRLYTKQELFQWIVGRAMHARRKLTIAEAQAKTAPSFEEVVTTAEAERYIERMALKARPGDTARSVIGKMARDFEALVQQLGELELHHNINVDALEDVQQDYDVALGDREILGERVKRLEAIIADHAIEVWLQKEEYIHGED
jgi:hypothetical protein